jgi:hypothetical protein
MSSWARPQSEGGLISQIFFNTNSSAPDSADDIEMLLRLHNFYKPYLSRGFSLTFLGFADYRPTTYAGGNEKLAFDRARHTSDVIMQSFQAAGHDITKIKTVEQGCGVDPQSFGTPPTDSALAGYRRTDIIASPVVDPHPSEPPPDTPMSNEWQIDIKNCTAVSVSGGFGPFGTIGFGLVKELFNARIVDLRNNDELWFDFNGEGLCFGPSIGPVPFGADVSNDATGKFTTVYNHTLREFEGRIAHVKATLVGVTGGSADFLYLHIRGGSRREDRRVDLKSPGSGLALPGGTTVTGDLKIAGPTPVP